MKKILILLFMLEAVFAGDIAIVKMTKGSPVVQRDGKNLNLSVGDKLNNKDILITDKNSKVGVIFNDGSTLTLSEGSFLNIEEFTYEPIEEKYKFTLKLDRGETLFESGKMGEVSPENFEFKIPTGTIGIRGTKFIINLK
ncbi:FecR domain-containing protein [Campylobacter corcagiensis]|uniref:FecR domain-containing protein n=1 Tax=Campylobacter corcagiensis TaxID=1448857 RepID=A0A7M1LI19_9BACT|nr:FecR domain-containing protein [Campylobacter corcagiensis]QKF65411.1 FecR domain-containing protein [Campylobacter corcagiensis]QOQ88013.1 FecR domain-containing protein [Campylobacter corcagiensis]